jgi:hypothetical protein
VGFVVVKARELHRERGLGALRQACRSGVAIAVEVVDWRGGNACACQYAGPKVGIVACAHVR